MIDDAALLRAYAEESSEEAFAELVRRHINLVYAVALRRLHGRTHAAEEITQQVFTALARKAAALSRRPMIAGWLHVSTRHAAAEYMRNEQRRRQREQEAFAMNESVSPEPVVDSDRLRALLDDAVDRLGEVDREAVLLRFFEERSFAEVGAALRTTEEAARKRVDRALEKIHSQLVRRGVTSTGTALSLVMASNASAAPASLAVSVTQVALLKATAAGGGVALVSFFTMSKLQAGIVGALLLAAAVTGFVEVSAQRTLQQEIETLEAGKNQLAGLQEEQIQLTASLQTAATANPEVAELTQARTRLAELKARPEGVTDAGLKPVTNAGRNTPEAAIYTLAWALASNDLDTKASFFSFSDDTPENRAAFMALLSTPVQAKYRTPERFVADATIGSGIPPDPIVAAQIVSVRRERADLAKVSSWFRTASGRELSSEITVKRNTTGWGAGDEALGSEAFRKKLFSRIDPATGAYVKKRAAKMP